jgi:hypothetical protein
MRRFLNGRRPSAALIVAVTALSLAVAGTGVAATISVLSKDEKKQVKKIARKQANKRITKRAPNLSVKNAENVTGVNSGDFFLSRVVTLDRPVVPGSTCDAFDISAPGIQATDHVLVTPPSTWAFTFTLVARPADTPDAVKVSICNTFTGGGAGDPDGPGGSYKLLVIR